MASARVRFQSPRKDEMMRILLFRGVRCAVKPLKDPAASKHGLRPASQKAGEGPRFGHQALCPFLLSRGFRRML